MLARTARVSDLPSRLTDDQWYFQQKLDGDRLLICVDDGAVRVLNRNGEPRSNPVPRKVIDQFRSCTVGSWVFDGELLDDTLWLFDLPRAMDRVGPTSPLAYRLEILELIWETWRPSLRHLRVLPTACTTDQKIALAEAVAHRGAEGLMLKHTSGRYRQGRSDQVQKLKLWNSLEAVVVRLGVEGRNNCEYAVYRDGIEIPIGSCSLEGKPPVKVGDVVEVKYLYASDDDKLYQPSLLRVRDDKPAEQCTFDQLVYTDRSVIDLEELIHA